MNKLLRLLERLPRFVVDLAKAYWALSRVRLSGDVFDDLLPMQTRPARRSDFVRVLTQQQKRIVRRQARLIDIASRYPFRWALCLPRSQALLWRLRSAGIDAALRVGVRKDGSQMSAHAWVEYDGVVLNDRQDIPEHFAPLVQAGDVLLDANSYRWDRA